MRISDWSSDVCSSDLFGTDGQVEKTTKAASFVRTYDLSAAGSHGVILSIDISPPLAPVSCHSACTAFLGRDRPFGCSLSTNFAELTLLSVCHRRYSLDRKSTRLNSSH